MSCPGNWPHAYDRQNCHVCAIARTTDEERQAWREQTKKRLGHLAPEGESPDDGRHNETEGNEDGC